MHNKTEVEIVQSGSTYKTIVDDDTLYWANTGERLKIMNVLKSRDIGFDNRMSTYLLIKLYERIKDKDYYPFPEGIVKRRILFGIYDKGKLKKCSICRKLFRRRPGNKIYCGDVCAKEGKRKKSKERNKIKNSQKIKFQEMIGEITKNE